MLPIAGAQTYPTKPIRLIVPYPPGASTNDILGREFAKRLSQRLGVQVVVDNRPGAGGNLGSEIVARATPDGHTLLIGINGPLAIGPSLYKLNYEPLRDLAPIALFASVPFVLVASTGLPARNLKELIAHAKAQPGQLNFAASGNGTTTHLCAELFKQSSGVNALHVPYKGGALAVVDLMAGHVQLYCTGLTAVLSQIQSGKVRALGLASLARSPLMPELPTLAEQGLAGFEVNSWSGLLAPAATPKSVIDQLHTVAEAIANDTEMKKFVINQGAEPVLLGPSAFAAYLRNETAKWARVAKTANVKLD